MQSKEQAFNSGIKVFKKTPKKPIITKKQPFTEVKKEITDMLPKKMVKKLPTDWQQEMTIKEKEADLLKDPFDGNNKQHGVKFDLFTRQDAPAVGIKQF